MRARLVLQFNPGVSLKEDAGGILSARFDGQMLVLGKFSAEARRRAAILETGLQIFPPQESDAPEVKEILAAARRLALHGLVEYRLCADDGDIAVMEPQMRDYAPRLPQLDESRRYVLSRFAYLRRRGEEMVLESPRANVIFRLCDAGLASLVAHLARPTTLAELRAAPGFPGMELLALLYDSQMLFALDAQKGLRASEGDDALILWDFHDLLFHVRSTTGRHANLTGGLYAHADLVAPQPTVRPGWPGPVIDLTKFPDSSDSACAALLRSRHSTRVYDDAHPITAAEVARLLDGAARIIAHQKVGGDDKEPPLEIAARPYPSGGASYELELYLAVRKCDGLPRGLYHYDADRHALVAIGVAERQLDALLDDAQYAMGSAALPQIVITMSARFGRVQWKYSGFAYSLVLKHVGVLMQTLYLMAAEMKLGACALGVGDIDLFARMTDIPFHVEGSVGLMAIGGRVEEGEA
ncbi:SagB family peptide dehydrogenase [Methylocystis echinoides]|uniref:Dehydrogenase n=1 Tax=Methylocystis echinoides TaxID=29468 RepID=A0A9W6LRF0_9HYPH|nr:SagB family peptide dehydrogenase [Methylocystis echinoides]GLI92468.1 dehydrogenase [Methylocystis echinoides]